ncbi:MAG: ATP-dependent zinc metalloprotease FtsH [Pseudomonadota bacterium]
MAMVALAGFWLFQFFVNETGSVANLSYSEFQSYVNEGKIQSVTVGETSLRGEFTSPIDGKTRFTTVRVEPAIADSLSESGVDVRGTVQSTFLSRVIGWLLPLAVIIAIWVLISQRLMSSTGGFGGVTSMGRSRAKVFVQTETGVTFDDVAGVDEAKLELMEVVDFLKNPDDYGRLGAHVPKGVLLVGPPGTGKTLLARAVAGQAGVPFYSISGSEFVELFVGVGAARVRDLFEQAREAAPSIIFIDELDAIGRARGVNQLAPHEEREQTLNQLLAEIDGFDPTSGVVLLAATNRPEILDPALLRAGRFDRQVLVDRPDKIGREAILKVHVRKIRLAEDADLEQIAGMTTGFSGADLANLVNEAAIIATRRRASGVGLADFEHAIERIVAGLEKKNRVLNEKERKTIAVHEMGHALTSIALPGSDPIQKVSIIPRGIGALGYTIQRPTDDRYLMTREELEDKICILLGGRAAELLVFETSSTGAADDLVKATDIARNMVEVYGMDEDLGQVAFQRQKMAYLGQDIAPREQVSEATANRIDEAIARIMSRAVERSSEILKRNRDILDTSAEALLKKETLSGDDLAELTKTLARPGQPKNVHPLRKAKPRPGDAAEDGKT